MEILNNKTSFNNFINGKLWKKKCSSYNLNDKVIPYFIFINDFETNNPLGSHTGDRKLTAVYYSFPVIPQEYISQLENIFLLMLLNQKIAQYTVANDVCFSILIEEIRSLE